MISNLLAATMLMATPAAMAQQSNVTHIPSITTTADAEIRLAPDLATIRIGVVAQRKTAQEAQNEVNTKMQAFLEKAKAMINSKGTIETGRINLSPVYSQPSGRPNEEYVPQIAGYRADNTLTINLTDFTLIGPVIDQAVASGLNNVEAVYFGLKDDSNARLEALAEAVKKAKRKAEVMAQAAGVGLGQLLDLNEGGAVVMPYKMEADAMRMSAAGGAPTPVLPGAVTVNAMVTIRYAIK